MVSATRIEAPANRRWLIEKLSAMFALFPGDVPKETMKLRIAGYAEHLAEYTEADFHDGLGAAIRQAATFAPSIASIREACDKARGYRHRMTETYERPQLPPPKPATPDERRAFAEPLVEAFKAKRAERLAETGGQTPFAVKKAEAQAAFDKWLAGERPPPLPTQGTPDGGKRLAAALRMVEP